MKQNVYVFLAIKIYAVFFINSIEMLKKPKSAGQLWYNQQTYRAINQAIGRVIRHKNDYGAILLCDERFTQPSTITQLPAWLKLHVQKITEHTDGMNKMRKFFNIAIENVIHYFHNQRLISP